MRSQVLQLERMQGVESNRFLLFSPHSPASLGITAPVLDYWKANAVPLIEAPYGSPGNATIPTATIMAGGQTIRTGAAICFDMEHPWHIRQLGRRADLVLNPSYDWPGLNP